MGVSRGGGSIGGIGPYGAFRGKLYDPSGQVILDLTQSEPTLSAYGMLADVRDWGAKGDGATDDTAAINSAISACAGKAALWLPSLTFLVSAHLSLLSSTYILGTPSSIIQASTGFNDRILWADGTGGSPLSNIRLEGFVVQGNGASDTMSTNEFDAVTDLWLLNLRIKNTQGYNPIQCQACTRAQVRGCVVESPPASDCIALSGCIDSAVEGCLAYDPYDTGVVLAAGCDHCVASGNTVKRVSAGLANAQSIAVSGSTFCVVAGNTVNGGGKSQFGIIVLQDGNTLAFCSDITIASNVVSGAGLVGIALGTLTRGELVGNEVSGSGNHGIAMTDCVHVAVAGNTSMNAASGYSGIVLQGCSDCTLTGNVGSDDQGAHTQSWGFRLLDNGATKSQNNVLAGNTADGNVTMNYQLEGSLNADAAASNVGFNPLGNVSSSYTNPPVAGTAYQNTSSTWLTIYMPAYATVGGTAGTVTSGIGATSATSGVRTDWISGSTASAAPSTVALRVPPGWYFKFTTSGATLGTAIFEGE